MLSSLSPFYVVQEPSSGNGAAHFRQAFLPHEPSLETSSPPHPDARGFSQVGDVRRYTLLSAGREVR